MAMHNFLEKYCGTMGLVIFLSVYSYIGWPVEPMLPTSSELHEVVGMPQFINFSSTTNSGIGFKVNGMVLNCDVGNLSGNGGCDFTDLKVDINRTVRATYFWMPTRLWLRYKMLYSLEQDGNVIMAPEQLHKRAVNSYLTGWLNYHVIISVFLVPTCLFFLLETFGAKPPTKQTKLRSALWIPFLWIFLGILAGIGALSYSPFFMGNFLFISLILGIIGAVFHTIFEITYRIWKRATLGVTKKITLGLFAGLLAFPVSTLMRERQLFIPHDFQWWMVAYLLVTGTVMSLIVGRLVMANK